MFTVSFYTNNSDNRYVNKILRNVQLNVQCQLKEGTSMAQPTFIVPYNANMYNCNYLYVSELKRYYYVADIYVEKQRMFVSSTESDVLMSFKEQLLAKSATIRRQQHTFNTYLVDNEYHAYAYSNIQTIKFSYTFKNPCLNIVTIGG